MMRRFSKASRNEGLVSTVSRRALMSRLADLVSLDHHGMRPQRKVMRVRSGVAPVLLRAVAHAEDLVGGGDVPAGVLGVLGPSARVASK